MSLDGPANPLGLLQTHPQDDCVCDRASGKPLQGGRCGGGRGVGKRELFHSTCNRRCRQLCLHHPTPTARLTGGSAWGPSDRCHHPRPHHAAFDDTAATPAATATRRHRRRRRLWRQTTMTTPPVWMAHPSRMAQIQAGVAWHPTCSRLSACARLHRCSGRRQRSPTSCRLSLMLASLDMPHGPHALSRGLRGVLFAYASGRHPALWAAGVEPTRCEPIAATVSTTPWAKSRAIHVTAISHRHRMYGCKAQSPACGAHKSVTVALQFGPSVNRKSLQKQRICVVYIDETL